jgi:hypothetical protein
LSERCEFVGGDFLKVVPRGGDLDVLSTTFLRSVLEAVPL